MIRRDPALRLQHPDAIYQSYSHVKKNSVRRNFIKQSALGLGGLAFAPLINSKKEISVSTGKPAEKKLHIICVGAYPGSC